MKLSGLGWGMVHMSALIYQPTYVIRYIPIIRIKAEKAARSQTPDIATCYLGFDFGRCDFFERLMMVI